MALNFTSTEQLAQSNGVKVLVYGDSGMGKTVLSATAPAPVLLSAESGVLSLQRQNLVKLFGENNQHICYNIPTITISTVDELTEAYEWMSKSAEAVQFQSVCIDSISEIAEVVLNNAKRTVKDPRQAYGELIEKMETVIRLFRDLPGKNVYMSAKMEPSKDELTGIIKYGPSMPGSKLGNKMPYFFDEVFRLAIGQDQQGQKYRYLQTDGDMQYVAKDRSGMLDMQEFPHLGSVFSKINPSIA